MPAFLPDDKDDQRRSDEARAIARQLAVDAPAGDWPELPEIITALAAGMPPAEALALEAGVRQALNEMYLYGALYCAMTTETALDVNGVRLGFPVLLAAGLFDRGRLFSFERLLPFGDDPSPQAIRHLADRFRGLADLCDRHLAGRGDG